MTTTECFLIAMIIILGVPFALWRLLRTDYFAPLVVVQIIAGILLGPGIVGAALPEYHKFIFNPQVTLALNGIGWWSVMLFVWLAGVELDLAKAWQYRRESGVTGSLAFGVPLISGAATAVGLLAWRSDWIGEGGERWQFVVGIGMSCSVTALPILVLLLEKLEILRQPLGVRMLRYASIDDIVIWGVLGLVLMDWARLGRQAAFLSAFALFSFLVRRWIVGLRELDRWYVALVWIAAIGLAADWAGMHFMVGAFLAGLVMDASWFGEEALGNFREFVLKAGMPVFFLSSGLRTNWEVGGVQVAVAGLALLIAAVFGKMLGVHLAGKVLGWEKGEATVIGWLLQTKGLIMIIFANVLLDRKIITSETFTALLLMAVLSTMLTIPAVVPRLKRMTGLVLRSS